MVLILILLKTGGGLSDNDKYSTETKIPQYEPSDDAPQVDSIINCGKVYGMIAEIEESNVSEKEKEFLRIAAYRHAVIDFDKAADYYAVASKEMQELMERSALVLIDLDDAIANGYTTLSESIQEMMEEETDG